MFRSSDIQYQNQPPSWKNTSNDYHAHISKMLRSPTVIPELPQYPNVFRTSRLSGRYREEQDTPNEQSELQAEVQFAVSEDDTEKKKGNGDKVDDGKDDGNGDRYREQRRPGFWLFKWRPSRIGDD